MKVASRNGLPTPMPMFEPMFEGFACDLLVCSQVTISIHKIYLGKDIQAPGMILSKIIAVVIVGVAAKNR